MMTNKSFTSLSRWVTKAAVLSSVMTGTATGFSSAKVFLCPVPSSFTSKTNLQVFVSPTDHDVKIEKRGSHYVAAQQQPEGATSGQASEDLLTLFNEQVTNEFVASHLYLSASIWFETNDFEGMARYMRSESEEERTHALSLIDFANKRSIPINLDGIPNGQSSSAWSSPLDVWQALLKLEQDNTQSLLRLAEAAQSRHDYAVLAFLNPFHMEQVDAEAKIQTILAKVKDEQKTPGLLRQLDHELGQESV
mmetsp:Transcript_58443/g.142924  ORF Transcript_58443/g.142924 Transcript_58443/m.142924 type:complete len:250 (+) Transcript_58443:170-919(+)